MPFKQYNYAARNALHMIEQVLVLPTVAPWHKSAQFVWATFNGHQQSTSGLTNDVYVPSTTPLPVKPVKLC